MKYGLLLSEFLLSILLLSACTSRKVIESPQQKLEAELRVSHGIPFLDVIGNEQKRILSVRLGMNTSAGNFDRRIKVETQPQVDLLQSTYQLLSGKQTSVDVTENNAVFSLVNADGYRLQVEVRIGDDGVAFRYRMPGKRKIQLKEDFTTFTFPEDARGYFLPISENHKSDGSLSPSYESPYEIGVPITQHSVEHQGWAYPALVKSDTGADTYWTLLTETAVRGNYCGTHLSEGDSIGCLRVAYPRNIEQGKEKIDYPVFNNATPWRVMVVSRQLKDIVQNTWVTDLAKEEFDPKRKYMPGRATWSWLTMGDEATTFEEQKKFIDLADTLKFEYCLIDANWDVRIGREKIKELSSYANSKGVGLWLWYNCSFDENSSQQTPNGMLRTHEGRIQEMAWLKSIGVRGIKVNFFGHDNQNALQFYEDLLEDANNYELGVNLHGSAVPRGWERMFPNVQTVEAAMGMEHAMNEQQIENMRPQHITMLAFTRNAIAPLDFTPLVLNECLGADSDGKTVIRSTTAAFELALPVILQSGVQHYGLVPKNLNEFPADVFSYISAVPASWVETRLLDGYPGEYVVMARFDGSRWFIAAINACKKSLKLDVDLSFTGQEQFNKIASKGKNGVTRNVVKGKSLQHLELAPNDGVIFY